jgi:DNA-binding sugar fermentation-stimulating protein
MFLFQLSNLEKGIFLNRPSKLNKSPFVGDVLINDEEKIVHVPSLDLGGKCVSGTEIYMKKSKNSGKKSKYNTPCCDYICQAVVIDEIENNGKKIICGAHPSLGETIVDNLLKVGNIFQPLDNKKIVYKQREICNVADCDMRSDFLVKTDDDVYYLIEVKTVVDTDYDLKNKSSYNGSRKVIHYSKSESNYVRKALFPWGRGNQKGPDGEKVVSARAIKHVREMTEIISGKKCDVNYTPLIPVIIFVVVREDAEIFRPNKEGCSSFCRYLKEAEDMGVNMIAIKSKFIANESNISVYYDKVLPIEFS